MTVWHRPVQPLPVQVRPVGGETVVSYLFRLADANGFARPTVLLRTIGEPVTSNVRAGMLDHHDITLNTPALARLEALTGRSSARLQRALPSLQTPRADVRLSSTTEPLISAYKDSAIRGHCQLCVARIAGHPNVRVHPGSADSICRHHHRWVETTLTRPNQVDLSRNLEIITAYRRFDRLLVTAGDLVWARQQLLRTTEIVTRWHHQHRRTRPDDVFDHLHARWDRRAQTLPTSDSATSLLMMPEAVALAEILCDLRWRRHLAMAHDFDLVSFYRLVARRLGQPAKFGGQLAYSYQYDPLKEWVVRHRNLFRFERDQHWKRVDSHYPYNPRFANAILPGPYLFK